MIVDPLSLLPLSTSQKTCLSSSESYQSSKTIFFKIIVRIFPDFSSKKDAYEPLLKEVAYSSSLLQFYLHFLDDLLFFGPVLILSSFIQACPFSLGFITTKFSFKFPLFYSIFDFLLKSWSDLTLISVCCDWFNFSLIILIYNY